jgi:hypothetical protein
MNVRWSDGGAFAVIPHWLLIARIDDKPASDKAIRLFAVLAAAAQSPERGKQLSQRWLAEQMGCATSSVRSAAGELVKVGALTIEAAQLANGAKAENVYVLHASPSTTPPTSADLPADPPADASADYARAILAGGERPKAEELDPPPKPEVVIAASWMAHAPPLIRHRDAVFRSDKTCRAIRAALRTYPVEDVTTAIGNYATVLGDPEYRWEHSWTLAEFLTRGLDRFVDEAEPLTNFLRYKRTATADAYADLADF